MTAIIIKVLVLAVSTLNSFNAPQPYQQWLDAAQVRTPSVPIILRLNANGCDGYECSEPERTPPVIIMFAQRDRYTRWQFLHEVGHVYSARHHELRRPFRLIIGLPQHRHWTWLEDEWLAMGYSWCAMGWRNPAQEEYPGYGYGPTVRQHRAVCALLR